MTVAKLSVHLFEQLLFVYILLEDGSSSHCVALEGSQGQNTERGLKWEENRATVQFSVSVEFVLSKMYCVTAALQNQYCAGRGKHMMPFKLLWAGFVLFIYYFFSLLIDLQNNVGISSSSCVWLAVGRRAVLLEASWRTLLCLRHCAQDLILVEQLNYWHRVDSILQPGLTLLTLPTWKEAGTDSHFPHGHQLWHPTIDHLDLYRIVNGLTRVTFSPCLSMFLYLHVASALL